MKIPFYSVKEDALLCPRIKSKPKNFVFLAPLFIINYNVIKGR